MTSSSKHKYAAKSWSGVEAPFLLKSENWQKATQILPRQVLYYIYSGYIVTFNRPVHFDNSRKPRTFWPKKFGGK